MNQSSAQRRRAAMPGYHSGAPVASGVSAPTTMLARLDLLVYETFEKGIPLVGSVPKTDIESGFIAGAEFVLRKLRKELVVG